MRWPSGEAALKVKNMKRAFLLGNPSGRYVQRLLENAPAGISAAVLQYEELQALLAPLTLNGIQFGQGLYAEDVILVRSMGRGNLENIVFRMDCLTAMEACGTRVINPAKSLEWAIDKFASLFRLQQAGLPVPPTHVAQTLPQAMEGFANLGGDVVVKPIFGSEGRGLIRVADGDHAARVFKSLADLQQVIYQQKFLGAMCRDVRILHVGPEKWAMERTGPDWRKNVARGGIGGLYRPTSHEWELAQKAMTALGLEIGGVDLLTDEEGKTYLLEVNGVPGWSGIERACSVNIAERIWAYALS